MKAIKREVLALSYAAHDPRTPWLARLLPLLVLAYALSPIDLIPGGAAAGGRRNGGHAGQSV